MIEQCLILHIVIYFVASIIYTGTIMRIQYNDTLRLRFHSCILASSIGTRQSNHDTLVYNRTLSGILCSSHLYLLLLQSCLLRSSNYSRHPSLDTGIGLFVKSLRTCLPALPVVYLLYTIRCGWSSVYKSM
jgi:hypothetical protein